MSYQLNRTNGTILTNLIDGQIDTYSTDLTLVGRSYVGYGEYLNENLIHMLEHFANVSPPENSISGQLWWNTQDNQLEAYDGSEWRAVGRPYVQDDRPNLISGDIWYDTSREQMFFNDGTSDKLIGPIYTQEQGTSGFLIDQVTDSNDDEQTVSAIYSAGELIGVISDVEFTPAPFSTYVADFPTIKQGVNLKDGYEVYGIAESARGLVDPQNSSNTFIPSDFITVQGDGYKIGSLHLKDNNGLIVGDDGYFNLRVDDPSGAGIMTIGATDNTEQHDFRIVVTSEPSGGNVVDAIRITKADERVGIFTDAPEDTLDVNGGSIIRGGLQVTNFGDSTSSRSIFDVDTFQTSALNLDLGLLSPLSGGDVSGGTPLSAGGSESAGIVIHVDGGNKTLKWNVDGDWWQTNTDFNVPQGNVYRIDGQEVLSSSNLFVTNAPDLVEFGPFSTVDDSGEYGHILTTSDQEELIVYSPNGVTLDASTYDSSMDGNITLVGNEVNVTGSRITSLGTPVQPDDAATKEYIDDRYGLVPLVFSLDATGYMYDDSGVFVGGVDEQLSNYAVSYLHTLVPPIDVLSGRKAKIILFWYESPQVTDVNRERFDADVGDSTSLFEYELTSLDFTTNGSFSLKRGLVVYVYQCGPVDDHYEWVWLDTESGAPEI